MTDDQRRAHDQSVADGADHEAVLDAQIADDRAGVSGSAAEAAVGPFLGDNLDRPYETKTAGLAHQRVFGEARQGLRQIGPREVSGSGSPARAP